MSVFIQNIHQNCKSGVQQQNFSNTSGKTVISENDTSRNVTNIGVNVSKDLVAAAGFNVEAPIVNAIIGNINGVLPTKKNELTDTLKCKICDCELTSNAILAYHINGSRHKKRLKALDIIAQLKEEKGVHLEKRDSPNAFRCEICSLTVNSAQQLEFHLSGSKHKKKIGKVNSPESDTKNKTNSNVPDDLKTAIKPLPKKKECKPPPKLLTCITCNTFMNSQTQYEQHVASKKHIQKSRKSIISRRYWNAQERPVPYNRHKLTNNPGYADINRESGNCYAPFYYNSSHYNSHNQEQKYPLY